jgi:ribosomal protein L29
MKFKDLKALSPADREKKFSEAKLELIKLNGQVVSGTTLKSPGQIKNVKRTMAKLAVLKKEDMSNNG